MQLQSENDHVVRAEWRGEDCHVEVEAWEAARAYDRASRMAGVDWGACLQTTRGTWLIHGCKKGLAFLSERR